MLIQAAANATPDFENSAADLPTSIFLRYSPHDKSGGETLPGRVTTLAEGVADLEYSVRTDELLKRWFSRALIVHIALSVVLYGMLAAHITASIYFGLRWLR